MDKEKWEKLFALNGRLSETFGILFTDLHAFEKVSGASIHDALDALDAFANAMTRITDKLNVELTEARAIEERQKAVEDVIHTVKRQIKLKELDHERPKKDRSKASE